jgi:hypothetical protein
MRIERVHLANLPKCYANAAMPLDGRLHYIFASELDAPCYAFDAESLVRHTVWEHPGGTMSIVPLKSGANEFLAVQRFKPKMMAPDTEIVRASYQGGNRWKISTLAKQGYIHRFDVLKGDRDYLLACTIASRKTSLEDWSCPGKLWAGALPEGDGATVELEPILEGLTRNHGYWRTSVGGRDVGVVSSDEGVRLVLPPTQEGDAWRFEMLIERPVSDIALVDIDGDGEIEIASIEPLHGDLFTVNKLIGGRWQIVYEHPGNFKLGHVVWGGKICGTPCFLGGSREGDGELFMLHSGGHSGFVCTRIDSGRGPANVTVVHKKDEDIILASNREAGEAALYRIRD